MKRLWALFSRQGCVGKAALLIAVLFVSLILCGLIVTLFPSPEPTPTPRPTTIRPTDRQEPTYTPLPTNTPYPTPTPLPSATPLPTSTSPPTATEPPTAIPMPTPSPTSTKVPGRQEAQVIKVVDGDTIKVQIGDDVYTVRYIGIDTPETKHPEKPVEWMGQEATAKNEELVGGQMVELEKDVSETDRYGRLLRYVWVGGTMVNAELVIQGYAHASSYPPDVKYQEDFRWLEVMARDEGIGLWGPTPTPPPVLVAATATPPTAIPTALPPTVPPAPAGAVLQIVQVDKRAEFVDIRNVGDQPRDLGGWVLVSERGPQSCPLGGAIGPGETLRIWAMAVDSDKGGFNCGIGDNIWNNSKPDAAVLYDPAGQEVDRYP